MPMHNLHAAPSFVNEMKPITSDVIKGSAVASSRNMVPRRSPLRFVIIK